ncbi:MAG TPA: hypothetical protein DD670_02750 [Planctomycetaceae bacterium]|nr:hypothetical protein [Planctomycetaceae bacterium]
MDHFKYNFGILISFLDLFFHFASFDMRLTKSEARIVATLFRKSTAAIRSRIAAVEKKKSWSLHREKAPFAVL